MTNIIKYNKKYIYNYLNNILINPFQETHQSFTGEINLKKQKSLIYQ